MNKQETSKKQIVIRTGAKSLKEFYSLSKEEKEKYIEELKLVPVLELGISDKHILHFFATKQEENKKFISMDI